MANRVIVGILLVLVLAISVATNPTEKDHLQVWQEVAAPHVRNHMGWAANLITSDAEVNAELNKLVVYNDYVVCSTLCLQEDGRNLTLGFWGKVFPPKFQEK